MIAGVRHGRAAVVVLVSVAAFVGSSPVAGQAPAGAPAAGTARAEAPVDLTGYWVSYVTEDWRYRMVTPPNGDYRGVPMNDAARKVANAWVPGTAGAGDQCRSYGAAAIMRMPGRLHITWQDDNTLRVEIDAGMQTRLFHFAGARAAGAASWQGHSTARWERPGGRGGQLNSAAQGGAGGSLTVLTRNMRAGYLRTNGVPYSANAALTEYVDVAPLPGNGQVLLLTAVVEDPQYLTQPFIVSSHFKKEADGSRWAPTPCSAP